MDDEAKEQLGKLRKDFDDLVNLVGAVRYFAEQMAVSALTSTHQTREAFDIRAQTIRNKFGVRDVTHPNAIKAAARTPEILKHLDRILDQVRFQIPE